MPSITIRSLDGNLKARLRAQAAAHGRSMEEEARELLRAALFAEPRSEGSLLQILRRRFAKVGPIDLELPVRDGVRAIPDFWT